MVNYYYFLLYLIYCCKFFQSLKNETKSFGYDEQLSHLSYYYFLQEVKSISNYYFTTLYLGKSKSPQAYILDTESSNTASPCDKCKSCKEHFNPKYKLKDKSKIISCNSER